MPGISIKPATTTQAAGLRPAERRSSLEEASHSRWSYPVKRFD